MGAAAQSRLEQIMLFRALDLLSPDGLDRIVAGFADGTIDAILSIAALDAPESDPRLVQAFLME